MSNEITSEADDERRYLIAPERDAYVAEVIHVHLPPPAPAPTPLELPADVSGFTGRNAELVNLNAQLKSASSQPEAPHVVAISGMAGVGKTALAVHWAHKVSDRFSDGCLYADLRGYDPDEPLPDEEALATFLRALGVEDGKIPHDRIGRATLYRTLVAERRMLILLDNAHSAEHIGLLLPASPSCFTIVTSRDSMGALIARNGASRLSLDVFPADDALDLLRNRLGDRIDSEQRAAESLAERCSRLPLALAIAAEVADFRSGETLEALVKDLANEQTRLDTLDAGEPHAAIRAVFSWSFRYLTEQAAKMFRILGLHPGQDIDLYGLASALGIEYHLASRQADALVRAHLWLRQGQRRFSSHDLLRSYARELADADSEAMRTATLNGLFDYYVKTAATAMDLLYPHEQDRRPDVSALAAVLPPIETDIDARTWLDAERSNLLASVAHMTRSGRGLQAITLCDILRRYLEAGSHHADASKLYLYGLHAARSAGDRAAEGRMHNAQAIVYFRQGRYHEAREEFQTAIAIFADVKDARSEGAALGNLGNVYQRLGTSHEALDAYERSLAIRRAVGDEIGEGHTLNNIGFVYQRTNRPESAIEPLTLALKIFRKAKDRVDESISLGNLGAVYGQLELFQESVECLSEALRIARDGEDEAGEADSLKDLGNVYRRMGRSDEAIDHLNQALVIARRIEDRVVEAETLDALGSALLAASYHGQARECLQHALAIYTDLRSPECDRVRLQLANIEELDKDR